VSRQIEAVGLSESTAARFSSEGLTARLEVGRAFDLAPVRVTPFVAVQDSFIDVSAYREAATSGGDLFALGYAPRAVDSPESDLGFELQGDWRLAGALTPYARADWLHAFNPTHFVTPYFSTFASTPFTAIGASPAVDSARLEAGFSWAISARVSAYGSYVGDLGANTVSAGGMAGIRMVW
jgi:outer membrane autotransporter protein